jgi:hypothetical protein
MSPKREEAAGQLALVVAHDNDAMFTSATSRRDMLIVIADHGKKKYRRSRATRGASLLDVRHSSCTRSFL